ncbi:LysR family transcriptional regulator [Pseudomonas putida]|uniref:LysR family transcriptional regulator n=1 Tax=Pseudomonas putida TaxID=303 RepID=A0AA37RES2_PSEPU|nr:LysR family transcriptional regulator [Pseudomonas putida]GLO12358.1 LysR family transcriptional regulator [Pseudomonas putida]GLO35259.1 LysR family transcriptional regulator [Pseudomonas putida]HDS0966554.1 LysR family transcriptional regulator [Pseudomonas putida]HDS0967535.1 LysR family transcriptional regulator [Pseudomonas putida]HDS0990299.1 LysR family transcriptional regulator [Pseudomonas putida]
MDHLTSIRAFQRIVETRSFTKAAAHLGMPRSSVSKALQELEQHLGTKLLQRTTRAVTLTMEGAEYYRKVSQLVARLDEAEINLRDMGAASRGRLRVDMHSSLAQFILIPLLSEFRGRHPQIQLALGISDRPVNLIEEGVDCVIRAGQLADSSLVAKTLFKDKLVTCASPGYLEQYGIPATPSDLDNHLLVGYFSASNGEVWPLRFRKRGGEHLISRYDVAANDSASQISMLVNGLGIGQTHATVAAHLFETGALVPILEDHTNANIPISVIYPPNKQLNARVRLFVDWIVERLSEHP